MSSHLTSTSDAEVRLLRALLRAGRGGAMVQDRIDCAEIALLTGERDLAAMLYGLVALQIGFSPLSLSVLREVESRSGLWGKLPKMDTPQVGGFSVDLALDELRRLMRFTPKLQSRPSGFVILPPEVPIGTQSSRILDPAIATLARRVAESLRSVPLTAANGGLAPLLLEIAGDVLTLAPIEIEEYADAGVEALALMLALEGMRRFLLTNVDLLTAKPAVLFDAASALEPGALGPFFANVRMLLRGTSDLFALIDAAADGKADAALRECWAVLLAAYLPNDRLASLGAEMGDRGMATGLHRLLAKIARAGGGQRPFEVIYSIRDASLDIDAFAVAGDAQQVAAQWSRADPDQWRRLGEIRGYAGDLPAAKAAFERALQLNPADRAASEQLEQIEMGRGIPFEEIHMDRRKLRRARRDAFEAAG